MSEPSINDGVNASEGRSVLDSMFSPQSVALIGATDKEGSVGRTMLERLRIPAFRGRIYPVHPTRPEVLGLRASKRIGNVPHEASKRTTNKVRYRQPPRACKNLYWLSLVPEQLDW